MNGYLILLFLHVLAGVGLYVALGIEIVALGRFQRAGTPGDAALWLRVLRGPSWLSPLAMLLALGSGIWMTVLVWGHQAWIFTAFLGLVGMAIAGGGVTGRVMRRLRSALAAEGAPELSGAFRSAAANPALAASLRLRIALGLGVLGLMTVKPEAAGSAVIEISQLPGGIDHSSVREHAGIAVGRWIVCQAPDLGSVEFAGVQVPRRSAAEFVQLVFAI